MKPFVLIAALAILSPMQMASAQTATGQTGKDTQPAPTSPCQAEPDANANTGNDNGGTQSQQNSQSGGLTGKLDPCNGVLKPPPTGDEGMTEPAPDQGKTPVIKPGQVPQQAPKE